MSILGIVVVSTLTLVMGVLIGLLITGYQWGRRNAQGGMI